MVERIKMGEEDMAKAEERQSRKKQENGSGKKHWTFEELRDQKLENAMIKAMNSEDGGDWSEMMSIAKELAMIRAMPEIFQGITGGSDEKGKSSEVQKLEEKIDRMEREQEKERQKWEREKEKAAADARIQKLEEKIDRLTEQYVNAGKKDEEDPILKELKETRKEIANMKEREKDEEEETFRNDIVTRIESLRDSYNEMANGNNGDSIDNTIRQMEEVEKKKERLGKLFGFSEKDRKNMSPQEMIDYGIKKIPEAARAGRNVKDLFSPQDYDDDVASPPEEEDVPAREVSSPATYVDPKLQEFVDSMKVRRDGAVVDPKGGTWSNPDGSLMKKQDLDKYLQTNPSVVENMIYYYDQAEEIETPKEETPEKPAVKKAAKKPVEEETSEGKEESMEPPKEETLKESSSDEGGDTPLPEHIQDYLSKGITTSDNEGRPFFADKDGVSFSPDGGTTFMTREDLEKEAKADPEGFWNDVQSIRKQVLEQQAEAASKGEKEVSEEDEESTGDEVDGEN